MDKKTSILHRFVSDENLYDVTVQEELKSQGLLCHEQVQPSSATLCTGRPLDGNGPSNGTLPSRNPHCASSLVCNSTISSPRQTNISDDTEPRMIFLPSCPSGEEWSNIVAATKNGISMTGTAAKAQVGPVLGRIDIGECDDSYLFRVSLPGVKRDEREFSCEVENDGKVLIRGVVASGESTVHKYSQVFDMQSQNHCPPGHFSISFMLPGPVNPHQFSGNFGTDGILEGVVMKVG